MTTADLDILYLDMTVEEHIETALLFLDQSQREFAVGDALQGSEKLWGAVAHAAMAYAQREGWPFGDHRSLKQASRRLTDESRDPMLLAGFLAAEKFHANFYHAFMQDYDFEHDTPVAREFVSNVVTMVQSPPEG
jgi:hypothetical protein